MTDEKLDIAFIVDAISSVEEGMPAICNELHDFLERLLANYTDFSLGLGVWSPPWVATAPTPCVAP